MGFGGLKWGQAPEIDGTGAQVGAGSGLRFGQREAGVTDGLVELPDESGAGEQLGPVGGDADGRPRSTTMTFAPSTTVIPPHGKGNDS